MAPAGASVSGGRPLRGAASGGWMIQRRAGAALVLARSLLMLMHVYAETAPIVLRGRMRPCAWVLLVRSLLLTAWACRGRADADALPLAPT